MGFFVFEALWLVFSAAYPMAFDEQFHVGVIQIYAHQWSPFLSGHPMGADAFGPVARDPSYLFHYILSFPYRLFTALGASETVSVILLRLINIGLFASSLVLFRKLLLRSHLSPALAHTSLAIFVLIPVVPLLAAQVNYDNAAMPIVAVLCLLMQRLLAALKARRIDLAALGWLMVLMLFGIIVKYTLLPLFFAAAVVLVAYAAYYFKDKRKQFFGALAKGYKTVSGRARLAFLALIVLGAGLAAQRYAVNVAQYGSLTPVCDDVLSVQQCTANGPWNRNFNLASNKGEVDENIGIYVWNWFYGMWFRLFFAVDGPASNYATRRPVLLPAGAAFVVMLLAGGCVVFAARRIFRSDPFAVFVLAMVGLYCAVLFADNYSSYLETGEPVAINGRYLLPLLLPAALIMGRAFSLVLKNRPAVKTALAGLALLLFLSGGGTMTYILRSDPSWNWPNSAAIHTNNAARKALKPLVPEGKPY